MDLSQGCRFCGTPADGLIYCSHLCAAQWNERWLKGPKRKAEEEQARKKNAEQKLNRERELVRRFGDEATKLIPLVVDFRRKIGAHRRLSRDEWVSLTFLPTVKALAYRNDVGTEMPLYPHLFTNWRWCWYEYLRELKRIQKRVAFERIAFRFSTVYRVTPLQEAIFHELYEEQEAIVQHAKRKMDGLMTTSKAAKSCRTSVPNLYRVARLLGLKTSQERGPTGKLLPVWSEDQLKAIREQLKTPRSGRPKRDTRKRQVRLSCDHEFSR